MLCVPLWYWLHISNSFLFPIWFEMLLIVFVYCNACTICHVFDIRSEIKEHLILNPTSAWCSLEFLRENKADTENTHVTVTPETREASKSLSSLLHIIAVIRELPSFCLRYWQFRQYSNQKGALWNTILIYISKCHGLYNHSSAIGWLQIPGQSNI